MPRLPPPPAGLTLIGALVARVSDYSVYESRDPSRQLLKCHAITTLPFNWLAAAATKKQDGKNVLPITSD